MWEDKNAKEKSVKKSNVGSQLEPKNNTLSLIKNENQSVHVTVVHCAAPSVDDTTVIAKVQLKTDGMQAGVLFCTKFCKNPECNRTETHK